MHTPSKMMLFTLYRGILRAAHSLLKDQGMEGPKFYWLASDGWGKQSQVVQGLEDFAVGAITVELESKKISGNTISSIFSHLFFHAHQ